MFRRDPGVPRSILSSGLTRDIPADELRTVDRVGTDLCVKQGREIMREQRVGRECFLVIEGSFAVERDGATIARLGPGDFVGEVALLTHSPRNATVTALEDSAVYAFSRREFTTLMRDCPVLAESVKALAAQRVPVAA